MNSLRKLTIDEVGPWSTQRGKTQAKLLEAGIKPGDIVCRLGNAYVFGYVHFSKIIANVTGSRYSHAGMVLEANDKDILLGDVDTAGLRRQFLVDWLDAVRGDSIGVLRFTGPDDVREQAVKNCRDMIYRDIKFPEDFEDHRFHCVEFICWCYRKAGMELCHECRIKSMPGWRWYLYPFARINGVDPRCTVWCVGNHEVGLYSSPHLTELVRVMSPAETVTRHDFSVRGA